MAIRTPTTLEEVGAALRVLDNRIGALSLSALTSVLLDDLVQQPGGIASPLPIRGQIVVKDKHGNWVTIGAGADGERLIADATVANGLGWGTPAHEIDVANPHIVTLAQAMAAGEVGVDGGAGQLLATDADDVWTAFAAGQNNKLLRSDTDETLGLKWSVTEIDDDGNIWLPSDYGIIFRLALQCSRLLWVTGGSNDRLVLGLKCNNTSYSGIFAIMEDAGIDGINLLNRRPASAVVNPTVRIYSADNVEANDYLDLYHDQTNARIDVGNGILAVDKGVDVTGDITVSGTVDTVDVAAHAANSDAHHAQAHAIESHDSTDCTGAELEQLTDGSETALHIHDARYYTEAEVDGLLHAEAHDIASHSDVTDATGANLETLTNGVASDADALHMHTKYRTQSKIFYFADPAVKAYPMFPVPKLGTLTYVSAELVGAGTDITFNLETRLTTAALTGVGKSDVWAADEVLTAAAAEENWNSFTDAVLPVKCSVWVDVSAITGAPTEFWLQVEYTID